MTFEGVSWNVEHTRSLTVHEFIKRGVTEGHYNQFNPEDQVQLLKEAYRLCGGAVTPPPVDNTNGRT